MWGWTLNSSSNEGQADREMRVDAGKAHLQEP
jgi:hypothetical protein